MNLTIKNVNFSKFYYQLNKTAPKVQRGTRYWDIWDYSLLILLIFALIGNTLTILVMRSKKMKNTNTSLFLTFMAIADICVLSLKFLFSMQKLYKIPVYEFCIMINVLPDIVALSSYWLIITTTLERTIAVWYQLKVSQIITKKRCFIFTFIMISFFTLLSSTQIFCLKSLPDAPYFCGIKGTPNGPYYFYYRTVYPWIKSAFMSWLPSILGIILNGLIIISLRNASKNREILGYSKNNSCKTRKWSTNSKSEIKSILVNKNNHQSIDFGKPSLSLPKNSSASIDSTKNNSQNLNLKKSPFKKALKVMTLNISQERQITIMLCTISITFVILTLPFSIYELLRKLNPNSLLFKNRISQRIVLFFLDCLHATNFILYCLIGKKFRDELLKIIGCGLAKQKFSHVKTSTTNVMSDNSNRVLN